jgi:hypothetical protein
VPAVAKTARPRKTALAKTPAAKKAPARPAAKKAKTARTPAKAPAKSAKPAKPVKQKLLRDGFTMPADDFALIDVLKEGLLGARRTTKKSELLRAGLHALAALPTDKLLATVNALLPLKSGRPKKDA